MFSNKPVSETNTINQFRYLNYLLGIYSLIFCIGIFYNWFIQTGILAFILNAVAAIVFLFNGYRIKIKVSKKIIIVTLTLALSQAIWVTTSILSYKSYFTPLPFLVALIAFRPSYLLYQLTKNNQPVNIKSINE